MTIKCCLEIQRTVKSTDVTDTAQLCIFFRIWKEFAKMQIPRLLVECESDLGEPLLHTDVSRAKLLKNFLDLLLEIKEKLFSLTLN